MRDDCAMLVTEYCEGGNLARNIVARKVNWYRRGRKVGGGTKRLLPRLAAAWPAYSLLYRPALWKPCGAACARRLVLD